MFKVKVAMNNGNTFILADIFKTYDECKLYIKNMTDLSTRAAFLGIVIENELAVYLKCENISTIEMIYNDNN